jgi:hypothetical protein
VGIDPGHGTLADVSRQTLVLEVEFDIDVELARSPGVCATGCAVIVPTVGQGRGRQG